MAGRDQERPERRSDGEELPTSYYLDESDPDLVLLLRQDGAFVAAFSATGATREGIVEAAREDYQAFLARLAKEGGCGGEEDEGPDPKGGDRG